MKIVADDKIPYIRGVFEPYADITYLPGKAITAKEVKACCAKMGMNLDYAFVYHPQSDEQVECANGLLLSGDTPRLVCSLNEADFK